MKFDRRFLGVSGTRRTLRVGVWWSGWIPRLRFAPRGMTVTALRVGVGGGRVKSPNGASHENPGQRPGNRGDRRERALKGRSNGTEPILRLRSLGMNGPPLQGLRILHGTNSPRALPWAGIGPHLRCCNAGGCLVVWLSGWIPRLRFAPRGMTVTALRVGVGGGRVKSPSGASHESPGQRPGNHGDSTGTSPERAIQRARSAFVGDEWAAPSGLEKSS
jgi:hypothetical protein